MASIGVPRGYDPGEAAWRESARGVVHTGLVHRRPLAALVAGGLVAALVGACSQSDGRTLPPADPDRTTTTPSEPVIQPSPDGDALLSLETSAFADGGVIPDELTCRSADGGASPPLFWTPPPEGTVSMALVVRDLNAGGFVHWVVTGIDRTVYGIGGGGLPEGAVEGPNSAGSVGWVSPCPPTGTGTHTYEFAVLALPSVPVLTGVSAEAAASVVENAALERAVLTGTVTAPEAP